MGSHTQAYPPFWGSHSFLATDMGCTCWPPYRGNLVQSIIPLVYYVAGRVLGHLGPGEICAPQGIETTDSTAAFFKILVLDNLLVFWSLAQKYPRCLSDFLFPVTWGVNEGRNWLLIFKIESSKSNLTFQPFFSSSPLTVLSRGLSSTCQVCLSRLVKDQRECC